MATCRGHVHTGPQSAMRMDYRSWCSTCKDQNDQTGSHVTTFVMRCVSFESGVGFRVGCSRRNQDKHECSPLLRSKFNSLTFRVLDGLQIPIKIIKWYSKTPKCIKVYMFQIMFHSNFWRPTIHHRRNYWETWTLASRSVPGRHCEKHPLASAIFRAALVLPAPLVQRDLLDCAVEMVDGSAN